MLGYIYQWMENIAFYLVVMVAVIHLVPGEQYKKYIRFFIGIILIFMLLTPIFRIFDMTGFPLDEYERIMEEIEGVTNHG